MFYKNSGRLANRRFLPTVLTLTGMIASTTHAMPALNEFTPVAKIDANAQASDPVLKSAKIFGDHLDINRIYVSPSAKKAQTGVYSIVATPACEILENQYVMTYRVPNADQSKWFEFALKGPVSPYFDYYFGNYISNANLVRELRSKIMNIDELKQKNADVVAEYESAKADLDLKEQSKTAAQAEYDKYPQRIKSLTDALIASASNPALLASYNAQIEATRDEFVAQAPRLVMAINAASKAFNDAASRLAEATGRYKVAMPDEEKLVKRIEVLNSLFETLQKSSKVVFDDNNKLLATIEGTAVGTASASYSIWADEVTRLQQIVNNSGLGLNVYPLPIYNIRMHAVQKIGTPSSVISNQPQISETLNNSSSIALVNNSLPTVGDTITTNTLPFESNGQPVEVKASTLTNDPIHTFQNIISRGAYCTGASERDVIIAGPRNPDNNTDRFEMELAKYKPRTTNILAQSVSLSYEYNQKNDPIDISCEMDIYKFSSWTSRKKSSGFLFWRKKKSTEERKMIQENGITCKNNISDFGPGSAERGQILMDKMMQEIGAEYILNYAKSYEVTTYKESDLPNPGVAAEKMGTAMQALCGGNIYCEVGSIVLKTGNELFGSAAGSSSGSDTVMGKISRRYNEHAYTTLPGDSVIDLTVTL